MNQCVIDWGRSSVFPLDFIFVFVGFVGDKTLLNEVASVSNPLVGRSAVVGVALIFLNEALAQQPVHVGGS